MVCRDEAPRIQQALDSILQQEPPAGGLEIIVADGLSTDGTADLLRRVSAVEPRLRLVANPGRIVSSGLNAAIRAAVGSIIVRMDAHTEYAPDYVLECLRTMEITGAENVGGPARTMADTYTEKAVAAVYHSGFAVGGAKFHRADFEGYVDTVTYGCWRKEAFDRFGYFDEDLVRNQDDEHNLRIIRGGGRIWQSPKIRSWYRPRGSLGALFNQYMQYGYWKVRVIRKHKLPASWRHLVPGAFVLALALCLLTTVLCPLSSVLCRTVAPSSVLCPLPSAALAVLLPTYGVAVLAASVHTAWRTEWKLLPMLPLVFPCYHFGYGIGFLRGIWDFVIRRKGAARWSVELTRAGTANSAKRTGIETDQGIAP